MTPAPSTTNNKCINGVVQPVGDGSNPQSWKCSGCNYTLTESEVATCLDFESKIQPPPSVGQGDEYDDIYDLFEMHNYTLPSLSQINDALSHGVIHVSHSAIYWTLYVLALKWTKKATDACYDIESSALKSKMNAQKKTKMAAKKTGKKGTRGAGGGTQAAHQITLNYAEDTIAEEELDANEAHIRNDLLRFFSSTYEPLTSSVEYHQKQKSLEIQSQKAAMGDEAMGGNGVGDKIDSSQCVPSNIELPLLAEHLWTLIAESASSNLHPLHPELLIIFDYLAQIQILKKRIKRAKFIWSYNYHLSTIINSNLSKETYKLKRLVTHTPRTISQLQHHYNTIEELYQKLAFHQEDESSTTEILKQFTLTAIDSDSDDDMNSLIGAMGGGVAPVQGMGGQQQQQQQQLPQPTPQQDESDDDSDIDDADELLLRSQFGQNIIKTAQQHQTSEAKTHATHHQSGIITSPNKNQIQANSQTTTGGAFGQTNGFTAFGNSTMGSGMGGSSNAFDSGMGMGFGNNNQQSTTTTNSFDSALSAPQQPKFQNSFGFSSSALFAPSGNQNQGQQGEEKKNVVGNASSFTVNAFGSAVFTPNSTTTQPKPATSQGAFAGGGFGSMTAGGNAFGSNDNANGGNGGAFVATSTGGFGGSSTTNKASGFGTAPAGNTNGFAAFSSPKKDGAQ